MPQPLRLTADPELARAESLQQSGRIVEAESVYRRVLARGPNNPSALHLLGLLARDFGHTGPAEGLLRRAVEFAPAEPDFRGNLGALLCEMGRLGEAAAELGGETGTQGEKPGRS